MNRLEVGDNQTRRESTRLCSLDDGTCQWVPGAPFDRRREGQRFRGLAMGGNHFLHDGMTHCERSRLVERDDPNVRESFEVRSAFDQHTVSCGCS